SCRMFSDHSCAGTQEGRIVFRCRFVYDGNAVVALHLHQVSRGMRHSMAIARSLAPPRFGWSAQSDAAPPRSPAVRTGIPGEAAIISRAMTDPAAFAPRYEHYVDAVYGFCLNRV